jgi:hypothetical protein
LRSSPAAVIRRDAVMTLSRSNRNSWVLFDFYRRGDDNSTNGLRIREMDGDLCRPQ